MLFRHSLRFQGYWLALFAWLVLSFAIPVSNALAQTDAGAMRICSAYGVHWLNADVSSQTQNSAADCPCLAQLIPLELSALKPVSFWVAEHPPILVYPSQAGTAYPASQPRAPPLLFLQEKS